ncbi:MAG: molybdenum cofactor guanylyltransferase MobA, partial [Betaproteobacteria bacterium]|nr:molybdenum cofactor guanylyltransferase MobA [Betaproteobacteria bacterium]
MGGADKGLLVHHGQPLVNHAIARLKPQVETIIVSANRNLDVYAALGHRVVRDTVADVTRSAGPL